MKQPPQGKRVHLAARVAHSTFEATGEDAFVSAQLDKWLEAVRFALSEERAQIALKCRWPVEVTEDGAPMPVREYISEART